MKRALLTGTVIIALIALYSYAQGMMGRGMMGNDLMQWLNGKEVVVALTKKRPAEDDNNIIKGKRIYQQRCAACHGDKSDGLGPTAKHLFAKPADFTSGLYKFRSTPSGSIPTNEDIFMTVSKGIRGTAMLPWFDLDDNERWYVTYYLKTLSERFSEEEADSPIVAPDPGMSNIELVNKGRSIYDEGKCWECHGPEGRGDGKKSRELKDDWGRYVRPTDFTTGPLKRGDHASDIYLTLATGLDGTPMASYSNSIPQEKMIALASYIKSLAGRTYSGVPGMMNMSQDERIGMMTYHHGKSTGMMNSRTMKRGMMSR